MCRFGRFSSGGTAALQLATLCPCFHRYRPGEFLVMSNSILGFEHPLFLVRIGFQATLRLRPIYVKPLEACMSIIPTGGYAKTRYYELAEDSCANRTNYVTIAGIPGTVNPSKTAFGLAIAQGQTMTTYQCSCMSTHPRYIVAVAMSLIVLCLGTQVGLGGEDNGDPDTAWLPQPQLAGYESLIPSAAQELHNGPSINRQMAAFILGQIGGPESCRILRAALDDADRWVRIHAGVALAQHGKVEGLAGSKAALYEGPAWLKFYAIYGLNQIRSEHARQVLDTTACKGDPFLNRVIIAARKERSTISGVPLRNEPVSVRDWSELAEVAAQAFLDEADIWFHGGDYDQAIRCNEAAIFLQPSWVDVYAASAWLQWSMNRHGAAITTYRRAIAANPDNWEAHFELGFYYLHHGRISSAVKYLKNSFELDAPPLRARSYAHALEKAGKLSQALLIWQQLDKRDSSGAVDANLNRLRKILSADE